MRERWFRTMSAGAALCIAGCSNPGTVTIDTAERYQEMRGWEALVNGMVECDRVSSDAARLRVLELAANDVGINRARLPLRGGYERPDEQFADFMNGKMTFDQWKRSWHAPQNDDADPAHADSSGFHWGYLDYTVETLILPLRELVRARGDELWLNVIHTGGRSAQVHRENPEEYAEFIVAAFLHLRDRWSLVPQSLEVVNEPNLGRWTSAEVAANLLAAKRRLALHGFAPRFIAPSTSGVASAVTYANEMLEIPGVREALTDISYHRYSGGLGDIRRIGRLRESFGYGTAMSERIGADVDTLYQDLVVGGVSSWEQFGLTHCAPMGEQNGGLYVVFAETGAGAGSTVQLTTRARSLRHYFRHVRLGAHRIGVHGGDALRVVAFQNPDQRVVVAMYGVKGQDVMLNGLPAGSYHLWWTSAGSEGTSEASVTTAGQSLNVHFPGLGAMTVYAR